MKWLSLGTTDKLINTLISEIEKPGSTLMTPPSPIFLSNIKTPHSPKAHGHTPPRSPSAEKYNLGKTFSPKVSNSLLFGDMSKAESPKNLKNAHSLHSSEDYNISASQNQTN